MKTLLALTLGILISAQTFAAAREFALEGRYEDPKAHFQFDFTSEGKITNIFHYNISKTEKIDVQFNEPLVWNGTSYITSTVLKSFEAEGCQLKATLFVTPGETTSAIDVTLQLPTYMEQCNLKNVVNFDFYAEKQN